MGFGLIFADLLVFCLVLFFEVATFVENVVIFVLGRLDVDLILVFRFFFGGVVVVVRVDIHAVNQLMILIDFIDLGSVHRV